MKMLCLITLMALAAGTTAGAQPGTTRAPHFLRMVDIHSHVLEGILGHTYTNRGDVHVSTPGFNMTCGQLVSDSPQSGGRLTHVVAETNVVIDATNAQGQPVHATGEKAVYDYSVENGETNEIVTLTGNSQEIPQVISVIGGMVVTNTGDPIVWNLVNNSIRVVNFHVTGQTTNNESETNPPATGTNVITTTKLRLPPGMDTNYPPGSLDLAHPMNGRSRNGRSRVGGRGF